MNIRDLHYALNVAKYGHFGKAAEVCHVSQPALSMQIQKLEDELDILLFERSNRKVMLTRVGQQILASAQKAINAVEEMKAIAQAAQDPFAGDLYLGAFPTLASYYLPKVVLTLTEKLPKLKLFLQESVTLDLQTALLEGSLDAAFLALPNPIAELQAIELFEDPFYLAVSAQHQWAKYKAITTQQLQHQSLLLLAEGHCLRDQALQFCEHLDTQEHVDFRATSLETLRQMVIANVGMTLIPKTALTQDKGIVYIPFKDKAPRRKIALVWRKQSVRASCLEKIARLLKVK